MTVPQVEAVFGHEAGHVRHRHIQHLLVFAFVGWLVVAGLVELVSVGTGHSVGAVFGNYTVACIGVLAAIGFWGVAFGWLSRRFENQADLFGASCVSPSAADCHVPCSVHREAVVPAVGHRGVCATGAAILASALDRVAFLNGIPHEERSWRHSSIGSRIRFLMSLAGDPGRAARFHRTLHRCKASMLILAGAGAAAAAFYGLWRY